MTLSFKVGQRVRATEYAQDMNLFRWSRGKVERPRGVVKAVSKHDWPEAACIGGGCVKVLRDGMKTPHWYYCRFWAKSR